MEQVRCTNCGSTAIIREAHDGFCKCEACGSTFNVPRAQEFAKVTLDHTQDIRAWREYLAKQLRLQQESAKARDYGGVKLFAQKILSVLPDDFCARYYVALGNRYDGNDTDFVDFLKHAEFGAVTPEERKEVTDSLVASAEPKYIDDIKDFISRAYPDSPHSYDAALDRSVKLYIQKLRYARTSDRDVFICHRTAAPDQDIADAICTRLEERGLRCWIAPRNILAGSQNYERDILKGVENCRMLLLVSSFKSIYSEDCEKELKAAVLDGKALYSYRIDDTPYDGAFEKALSVVQWLDARDDPYAHLEQLVIDVKGILAQDEREKAELEEKRLAAREKERVLAEELRNRERERIERLEKLCMNGAQTTVPSYTYRSRLKRAEIEINSGNYKKAQDIIDDVLDADPENPLAWWLLLLCDYRLPSDDKLLGINGDFTVNRYFKNAERFSENDPTFARRLDAALAGYQNRAVKSINDVLSDAEKRFDEEDFEGLSAELEKCRDAFSDDEGIIFRRFPDVASRYYWLALWAKYGQTPLVCVEDITREREYQNALKYASPTQAIEYERARETVSKNAQLFLRERSKHRVNDGKLVDYLVDNKNILPVDTYNHYSSLLYFRKMLKQLNMTEDALKESTVDISTNEYFMLAQSLATDEQAHEYDMLLERLDDNRSSKRAKVQAEKDFAARKAELEKNKLTTHKCAQSILLGVFAALGYVLFALGFVAFCYGDGDSLTVLFMMSGVARIVSDVFIAKIKNKKLVALSGVNLATSILSIMFAAGFGILGMWDWDIYMNAASPFLIAICVVAIIIESIKVNKSKGDNNG